MRPAAAVLLFLVFAVTLAGCQPKGQFRLFNNTGEVIVVSSGEETVTIEPRQSGQFYRPQKSFSLSIKECKYTYEAPYDFLRPPAPIHHFVALVQIEQDLSIYTLPINATGITPVAEFAGSQADRVVLHPVSKKCG